MDELEEQADHLIKGFESVVDAMLHENKIDPRCASLAKTKIQEAWLWFNYGVEIKDGTQDK